MAYIDFADPDNAGAGIKEAWAAQQKKAGSVSNMKKTLLHNLPTYLAYQEWYPVSKELVRIVGERGLVIFSHAISTANSCLLCSTYFRKDLSDLGQNPDSLVLDATETLLVDLASALVKTGSKLDKSLKDRLAARFAPEEIVVLVGFAGLMIATNIFNSALEVPLDSHLGPFKKLEV